MLVLSQADVAAVLDMAQLVEVVEQAMVELSTGTVSMPPRVGATVDERAAILAVMPAHLPSAGALVTKLVSVFPQNRDIPTHQALICCFDPTSGTPVAVMDGTLITAMRTAAGSAVATRLLARADARRVAVIGTGVQSRTHVAAMQAIGYEDIVVAGRSTAVSIEDAVRDADVVCATTNAAEPVVRRPWLRPGTHVNSVGVNLQGAGEVDLDTVRESYVVVESRDSTLAPLPSGAVELLAAIEGGVLSEGDVAEIGEVAAGTRPRRADDRQLTLYKSVGVAVQDAASAAFVLREAQSRGLGVDVPL